MKIINAYDGKTVQVGDWFAVPGRPRRIVDELAPVIITGHYDDGRVVQAQSPVYRMAPAPDTHWQLVGMEAGLLSAKATVRDRAGTTKRVTLSVRWTHPSFFLQRVAFIPT